jgi:hypothetical protein
VIGIDPDSKAHGVAIYSKGVLTSLKSWPLMEIMEYIQTMSARLSAGRGIVVSIEDVCANNAMFHKAGSKAAQASIGRRVGMVQQAQTELERMCEWLDVPVVKNKISSNWKNQAGKKQFEKVTGWVGRSNEDTRSAAYFGWLHAKKS